jgi:hypothetical protein
MGPYADRTHWRSRSTVTSSPAISKISIGPPNARDRPTSMHQTRLSHALEIPEGWTVSAAHRYHRRGIGRRKRASELLLIVRNG